jgi:hypothetical protein
MGFKKIAAVIVAAVVATGSAQAAFVLLPDAAEVLDTTTNLVWLADWNVNNQQDWQTQAGQRGFVPVAMPRGPCRPWIRSQVSLLTRAAVSG